MAEVVLMWLFGLALAAVAVLAAAFVVGFAGFFVAMAFLFGFEAAKQLIGQR